MEDDLLMLVDGSHSLNPDIFSLIRLQLLSNLADLLSEGATYRELKAALQLSDGALYSNLKALEHMGYIRSLDVRIEERELKSYQITNEGLMEWERMRSWLQRFLGYGGEKQ